MGGNFPGSPAAPCGALDARLFSPHVLTSVLCGPCVCPLRGDQGGRGFPHELRPLVLPHLLRVFRTRFALCATLTGQEAITRKDRGLSGSWG